MECETYVNIIRLSKSHGKMSSCKQEFRTDVMDPQLDRSGEFRVFTCPECDTVLGIVKW
jgi:hypothetical protein